MTNTLTQQLQEKAVRALQNLHDYINREVGLPTGMPGLGTITLGSREEMYEDFITKLVADVVEENMKLLDWSSGDDTGISSKSILRYMLGLEPNHWGCRPPSDESDRGRCIKLLKIFPDFIPRLDEMKSISNDWDTQIELIKKELSDLNKQ